MQPTADPTSFESLERPQFLPGIAVPLPDDVAILSAWERLSSIDIGVNAPTIAGLGMLAESVAFVAGVQAHPFPRPILSSRVVLVTGSHAGGLVAGAAPDPRHSVPLQQLASAVGAGIVTLEWQPASGAIELEDAITQEQMDTALKSGWAEAERAADEGIELLILAAGGPGASPAAVAVISAISGYEATALLGRVLTPAGVYDDNAWMTRCLALRDAMHRVRNRDGDPRTVLSALGGADLAAATGLLLGAASRRLPVMIDGPVGAAAAMLANDFAPSVRRWLMMPDTGRNVALIVTSEALELRPWVDLCLDLGEGATSLAVLPLLQMALTLAGAGEPVQPGPMTRFDSATGGQVFVGVARPVEPAEAEEPVEEEKPVPSAALTGPTTSIGAKAKGAARPAPPKPAPAKAAPRKAAKTAAKAAPGKATPAKDATSSARPAQKAAAPAEAAKPITPAEPAKPTTPAEPAKPTTAAEPAKQTTPAETAKPTASPESSKAAPDPRQASTAATTPASKDAAAQPKATPAQPAPQPRSGDQQADAAKSQPSKQDSGRPDAAKPASADHNAAGAAGVQGTPKTDGATKPPTAPSQPGAPDSDTAASATTGDTAKADADADGPDSGGSAPRARKRP